MIPGWDVYTILEWLDWWMSTWADGIIWNLLYVVIGLTLGGWVARLVVINGMRIGGVAPPAEAPVGADRSTQRLPNAEEHFRMGGLPD